MDWIDWLVWACIFIAGYGTKGAADDARYVRLPRAKHQWDCPHCPMIIGVSDAETLSAVKRNHMTQFHPEAPQ